MFIMGGDIAKDLWMLTDGECSFVEKYKNINRLKGSLLLKFFQQELYFPLNFSDISPSAINSISRQLDFPIIEHPSYHYDDRTSERQRQDIRKFLGFRLPEKNDYSIVQQWLINDVIQGAEDKVVLLEHVKTWFCNQKIELPARGQQERIINSALC